eukprot:CAMPEP_0178438210 /NCGR_PEP_ID=MMETSP0689_2-20121128/35461_1 /TAXON_ID=160604 /ORGANISM="Amphidinium massartii, Strain CS-259" /LENGTH=68 /DNA_ID=CAMNT_0020060577 /DNA_START=44 /DNA_END=250 /DNA_ORIENTATION=-
MAEAIPHAILSNALGTILTIQVLDHNTVISIALVEEGVSSAHMAIGHLNSPGHPTPFQDDEVRASTQV